MSQIRNFYFANKEAPILWLITKSQLYTIFGCSILPWMWLLYNIKSWNNTFMVLLSLILLWLSMIFWFAITSIKIDWRNIIKYVIDKRRVKVLYKWKRKKIPWTDMNQLIDSIKS